MTTNNEEHIDAIVDGLTDNQSPDHGNLSAPLRERDSSNSIVAREVAREAAERVLDEENLTEREIRTQSAYCGNELDVGQQAAHAERARAETEREPPTE